MPPKRQSGVLTMLRGPGRMIVLILCGVVFIYIMYNFAFSESTYKKNSIHISHDHLHEHSGQLNTNIDGVFKWKNDKPTTPKEILDLHEVQKKVDRTKKKFKFSKKQKAPPLKTPSLNERDNDDAIAFNQVNGKPATEVKPKEVGGDESSVIGRVDMFKPRELSNDNFYTHCNESLATTFHGLHRLVHLDLKGARPNMLYLKELFPVLNLVGATGLLIEYEDMFPYSGSLKSIAADDAYSVDEIRQLLKLARDNGLTMVIPLIQTFGHMEFVLKYDEFRDLRETDETPQVIRPSHPKSLNVIKEMIKQVLAVHHDSTQYIHIGCDEVYRLGSGKVAEYMQSTNTTAIQVFFRHVKDIVSFLPEKVHALMWDDMFRKLPVSVIQKSGLGNKIEPMVWQYSPRPQDYLPSDIWHKYANVFGKVWAASSFKGATGSFKFVTDSTFHLSNHLNWIEIMKKHLVLFRGTVLTGWQRYDHFATLCELLPVAIPTLAFSLRALTKGCFDKASHEFVSSEILKCKRTLNITLPKYVVKSNLPTIYQPGLCQFPGHDVYDGAMQLYIMQQYFNQASIQSRLKSWMNRYNLAQNFSSPGQMFIMNKFLNHLSTYLLALHDQMDASLKSIYADNVAHEWMVVNFYSLDDEVNQAKKRVLFFSSFKSWKRRPFKPISVHSPDILTDDKFKAQFTKYENNHSADITYSTKKNIKKHN